MKKQALTVLAMASLFVLLAVGSAYADPGSEVRADVPFDFIVGNKTHPAGSYAVEYTQPQGVFLIHIGEDESRHIVLWSNTVPAQSIEENSPKLLFNRYGDQYFLTQVWGGGDIDGRELRKFATERELAMEYLAKDVSVPEVVSVAAVLQSLPVESAGNLLDGTSSASVTNATLRAKATRGYRVVNNSFSAEYGMTTGGQVTRVSNWELKVLF